MRERAINISSINREKLGRSSPEDFVIKFDPTMHLNTEMHHELAVDRVSMAYSSSIGDGGTSTIPYTTYCPSGYLFFFLHNFVFNFCAQILCSYFCVHILVTIS